MFDDWKSLELNLIELLLSGIISELLNLEEKLSNFKATDTAEFDHFQTQKLRK